MTKPVIYKMNWTKRLYTGHSAWRFPGVVSETQDRVYTYLLLVHVGQPVFERVCCQVEDRLKV